MFSCCSSIFAIRKISANSCVYCNSELYTKVALTKDFWRCHVKKLWNHTLNGANGTTSTEVSVATVL